MPVSEKSFRMLHAMAQADLQYPVRGDVLLDDAYVGGEKAGAPRRGSPKKVFEPARLGGQRIAAWATVKFLWSRR